MEGTANTNTMHGYMPQDGPAGMADEFARGTASPPDDHVEPGAANTPGAESYALGLEEFLSSEAELSGLEIDKTLEAEFCKMARDMGLKKQDAASMAQMYARHQARLEAEGRSRREREMREAEAAWIRELKTDRNFPVQLGRARAAVKTYGTPELLDVLEDTRLGSHPAFVRFMARVGEALAEPGFATGEAGSADKSPAEVLYPNQSRL